LVLKKFVRNAGDHCYCAYEGHLSPQTNKEPPKVKAMFSKTKKEDEPVVENRIITEEEIEVD